MIFLNIGILMTFMIIWFLSRRYEKEFVDSLDEKQYKLKQFYPSGLYICDKLSHRIGRYTNNTRTNTLDDTLISLHVGENVNVVKRLYFCNKVVLTALILFLSNLFALGSNLKSVYSGQLINGRFIQRPGYTEGSRKIPLKVNISENAVTLFEDDIELEVKEKRYSAKELKDKLTYAKQYIDSTILNKNITIEQVRTDLKFVKQIPGTGLTVKWKTGDIRLIDERGRVYNEEITEGVLTSVTAIISYFDRKEEYTRYIHVLPRTYSKEELAKKTLTEVIDNLAEKTRTEELMELPNSLGTQKVSWAEKEDNSGPIILLLGGFLAITLYVLMDKDLYSKIEKRNREMLLDYPEIINKFTLLVGAGMSLSNAWCKISRDYKETQGKKRYAYEEMMITYGELMLGTSESIAYERFGRRVKLLPYLRFSSMIAQNVKKGSVGLLGLLELEAAEAFEERKELAKRMGEEAGTKLLAPMMIMLLIVLAIIMLPAFMSFGI